MFGKIILPPQRLILAGAFLGFHGLSGIAFAQTEPMPPLAIPLAPAMNTPVCAVPPASRVRTFFHEACRPAPAPPPLGASVNAYADMQIARAEEQQHYITLTEWYLGGATLGPAGRRHFDRLARSLTGGTGTIFLEPAEDVKLNGRRQLALVQDLTRLGVANPDKRIVIATPLAEGLAGEEAVRIYPRMFFIRGFGGQGGGGAAGGGFGGMGGGGFGGGGLGIGGFGGVGGISGRGY